MLDWRRQQLRHWFIDGLAASHHYLKSDHIWSFGRRLTRSSVRVNLGLANWAEGPVIVRLCADVAYEIIGGRTWRGQEWIVAEFMPINHTSCPHEYRVTRTNDDDDRS
jgi:hypothetical protein